MRNVKNFKYYAGTCLDYIHSAFETLIVAYNELIGRNYDIASCDENKIRDELVRTAEKCLSRLNFTWTTEMRNLDNGSRIDIGLITPYSLKNHNHIEIECKIVGPDKYIDTKKTFTGKKPTNGIMSFITGKYCSRLKLGGMIGFIKEGDIDKQIANVKRRLSEHKDIETTKNIASYEIDKDFKYSYVSQHKRTNKLPEIDLYHLFFDFAKSKKSQIKSKRSE